MELLEGFAAYRHPSTIRAGVYDIHSAHVLRATEMVKLMQLPQQHLASEQLWVNPDCGLKARQRAEVKPAIEAMVAAARTLRAD